MRKHFLILMLFALLPLAGWAQGAGTGDISQATVYIEPFGYGGYDLDDVDQVADLTVTPISGINLRITDGTGLLTEGDEYTVSNVFYTVDNGGQITGTAGRMVNDVFTPWESYTQLPVGKYAVRITGINTYAGSHTTGIFEVKPAALEVSWKKDDGGNYVPYGDVVKVYGTTDPTMAELVQGGLIVKAVVKNSSYMNGQTQIPATEINLEDNQIAAITYTRTANENANAYPDGTYFNATAQPQFAGSGYKLTWDGLTGDNVANYDIYYESIDMKIKQVTITAAQQEAAAVGFHITSDPLVNVPYDGENHPASFTITYKNEDMFPGTALKPVATLTETTDYTLSYTYSTTQDGQYAAIEGTPRNAGFYKVFVNGTATGNYYTANNGAVQYGAFQITKADADVVVIAWSKTYNGKAFTFDANEEGYHAPEFSISGLVPSDEGKVNLATLTAEAANNVQLEKYVGNYSIVANVQNAKIVYGTNNQVDLTDNYNVTPLPNNWSITKKTLKITASDATVAVGENLLPGLSQLTFDGDIEDNTIGNPTDQARLRDAFTITLKEGANTNTSGEFAGVFIVTRKAKSDYNDYVQQLDASDAYDAAAVILDNYDFETEGNITNGKLTVGSINFTIRPIVPANTQYGTAINPTYYAYTGTGAQTVVLTDENIDKDNITYQYSADGGETWTTTAPTTVNPSYKVKIVAKDATKPIGKGNYEHGVANTPVVQFAINPKTINITIDDVSLWNGATLAIMQAKATAATEDYANDLEPNETIEFEYAYVETNANAFGDNLAALDNAKTITFGNAFPQAGVEGVITVTPKAGDNDNDNYDIHVIGGKLIQIPTPDQMALQLKFNADNTANIADASAICAANNNVKYNVTFNAKTLKGGYWYTMVLPFATTPAKLVAALKDGAGQEAESVYAVVNRMKAATEDNKISFKLELSELPAGEPFLIKVEKDINMVDASFTNVVINATSSVTVNNNTFQGVYAPKDDVQTTTNQKVGWLITPTNSGASAIESVGNIFVSPDSQARELTAMEAYLIYASTSAAPCVTVEEADGSTTAITEVSAGQFQAVKADGWYTLNGVKLQGAPTEKGIYINNGKKIVVK